MTKTTPENQTAGNAPGDISHGRSEAEAEAEAKPPIANLTGWVSRWGKWVAAKVIGWCENGTRYRILYQTKCGEWDEALAFPCQMRWDPTLDNFI